VATQRFAAWWKTSVRESLCAHPVFAVEARFRVLKHARGALRAKHKVGVFKSFVGCATDGVINARVGEGASVSSSDVLPLAAEEVMTRVLLESVGGAGGEGGGIDALLRVMGRGGAVSANLGRAVVADCDFPFLAF
jgi:hypothetical protein